MMKSTRHTALWYVIFSTHVRCLRMLIPHKYEDISQNFLSVGLDILHILERRRNVYNLYKEVVRTRDDEYELSLNKFFLALDFLYAVGIIDFDKECVVRLR